MTDREKVARAEASKVADAVAAAIASVSVAYSHDTVGDALHTVNRLWSVHETGGNPFEKNEWLKRFDNKDAAEEFARDLRKQRAADAALSAMQGDGWRGIEPVAWRYTYPDGADRLLPYRSDRYTAARGWTETPLYALPTLPSAPGDEAPLRTRDDRS